MIKEFDERKMAAFGEKLVGEVATMFFGNMAYIGEKLGLYKTLSANGAVTAEQLAKASGLNTRYLREWLSAMAAAGWIEYEADTQTFSLPTEYQAFLTDETSPMYFGGALEAIGSYGGVLPHIVENFRTGGGLTIADHHADMPKIIDRISTPLFNNFLTTVWIPQLLPEVHEKLMNGAMVADVGAGSGRPLALMAKAYPNSKFVGYEPDEKSAVRAADLIRQEAVEGNAQIERKFSSEIMEGVFDFITAFDVVHDAVNPAEFFKDVRRALKSDGTFLMMEMNCSSQLEENLHPLGKLEYSISTLFCLPYSLAYNGAGIGTCMGEDLPRRLSREAGFTYFQKLVFEHPMYALYEVKN